MSTLSDLSRVLLAGAVALDLYNPCAQHGADAGEPCTDDESRAVYCTSRTSADPIMSYTMRAMSRECLQP